METTVFTNWKLKVVKSFSMGIVLPMLSLFGLLGLLEVENAILNTLLEVLGIVFIFLCPIVFIVHITDKQRKTLYSIIVTIELLLWLYLSFVMFIVYSISYAID